MNSTSAPSTNWAGNVRYTAAAIHRPRSLEELQEAVAGAPHVRALGSRHSFSDLADGPGLLLDLAGLPHDIEVDRSSGTVSLGGGTRYGDLVRVLAVHDLALGNLASLPHISVAGAVATGTHGSGDGNPALSAAVRALDVVGPDGAVRRVRRGDDDFDGSVVALGALGIVSRLELDVEPAYAIRQQVRTGLGWSLLAEGFDDVTASGYSVSLFTRFGTDGIDQVWVKSRAEDAFDDARFGTVAAPGPLHMLLGGDVRALTPQDGEPGPWHERLPHFRMEFTPSRGEELQSEYHLPRRHALAGIEALRRLAPSWRDLLQVAEIRTIAADELWLSGCYEQQSVALHFTWVRDEGAVRRAVSGIEEVLAPLGARPHWGKVFEMGPDHLRTVFPRLGDFAALRDRVDPDRTFGNAFLDRVLG